MGKSILVLIVSGWFLSGVPIEAGQPTERLCATTKGSLLMFSKVELKWSLGANGYTLDQDSFLTLHNDYPESVGVQLFFVNGDPPLEPVFVPTPAGALLVERGHPGWNWVDCFVRLTREQPTFYTASTGKPMGCPPFTILDPGTPPGRPDPEARSRNSRVLRGFVYAWAVKADPRFGRNVQIRWNHLTGDASLVNYARATAARYSAFSAAVVDNRSWPENGDFVGEAGVLSLDGIEYAGAFDKLNLDFYASGSLAYSRPGLTVATDTDLTVHPVGVDFRRDNSGPISTKVDYDIWNEDEVRFTGTQRCVTCWDQTLMSRYAEPNHFRLSILHTDKGTSRVQGLESARCPSSEDAALLGVSIEQMSFFNATAPTTPSGGRAASALNFVGQGFREAKILYDLDPLDGDRPEPAGNGVDPVGLDPAPK